MNKKILIAIEKNLKNAQTNINNLTDSIDKNYLQNEVKHLLNNISILIETEKNK
jgi:hypothetical protein